MTRRDIKKNTREFVRVTPSRFMGHDVIDVRIWLYERLGFDEKPTKSGVNLSLDLVPDLIDALKWALQQPCTDREDEPERAPMSEEAGRKLGHRMHELLKTHGTGLHWDSIEKMLAADRVGREFDKWQLHYVLVTRSEFFEHLGSGRFRAK